MKISTLRNSDRILLALLLLIAAFLRFYRLSIQSFWLDEIHTVLEAGPDQSWGDLIHTLKTIDQHPPLFFLIEKLFFSLFGVDEFVARSVSAIGGVIGVWVIYRLGKEFYSVRLGLIAAALTCFNHFHIYYSQEARPYGLLFLFTSLSFLHFIKLLKNPSRRQTILYSLFSLLMLYTHYFGLFSFIAQMLIVLVMLIAEKEQRMARLKFFFFGGLGIGLGYLPWLPAFMGIAAIKKFWIEPTPLDFATRYFYEFFGNAVTTQPLLYFFLVLACIGFFVRQPQQESETENKTASSPAFIFTICFGWITLSLLIPFIRSVLLIPMLNPRYVIVVLPAFLIILSVGIYTLRNATNIVLVLAIFCALSYFDMTRIKKHYSIRHKTQFREMAAFVSENNGFAYPIFGDITSWHQSYYLGQLDYKTPVVEKSLNDHITYALDHKNDLKGFWLTGAHGTPAPGTEVQRKLGAAFIPVRKIQLFDAWAQLYLSSKNLTAQQLNYRNFPPYTAFADNKDSLVPIWDNNKIQSDSIFLTKGSYQFIYRLSGTSAMNVYPHLHLSINDQKIGHVTATSNLSEHYLNYTQQVDSKVVFKLMMSNDTTSASTSEDRNSFLESILLIRQ